MTKNSFRKYLLVGWVSASITALSVAALAGNTTFLTDRNGQVVFPISPPNRANSTPGTIDNMTIGATTPAPATITDLVVTGSVSGASLESLTSPGPIGSVAPNTGAFTTLDADSITGTDSSLGITGQAAAQGGAIINTGGTSSTAANAGGAVSSIGGTPGVTGVGGAALLRGGIGGATSGTGGIASTVGGAATAGNSAGGAANLTGGAGSGNAAGGISKAIGGAGGATGAGGAAQVTGGAGGATSGDGGAVTVTGGAGTAGNGNGGSVVLTGGAKNGTGVAGGIRLEGLVSKPQGAPTAKTVSATLTAAELLAGIITVTQGSGANSAQQVPTGTAIQAALPADFAAGDSFDVSIINLGGASETASLTVNTDVTIVGRATIDVAAATASGSGIFRFRKTADHVFVVYRIG